MRLLDTRVKAGNSKIMRKTLADGCKYITPRGKSAEKGRLQTHRSGGDHRSRQHDGSSVAKLVYTRAQAEIVAPEQQLPASAGQDDAQMDQEFWVRSFLRAAGSLDLMWRCHPALSRFKGKLEPERPHCQPAAARCSTDEDSDRVGSPS
jgi:hypothetical protein